MDGNIQKALWLGVGIMVFLAVVTIGMAALSKGQDLSRESMDALDDNAQVLANAQYSLYDNQSVSGTDALNAIKKYKASGETLSIVVTRLSGTSNTYDTSAIVDAKVKDLQTKGHGEYINPYGEFYATIQYDTNGVVTGFTFVQQ